MKTDDFTYDLPPSLIATRPAARRDASRLLVMDRGSGTLTHTGFGGLVDELHAGDCLVLNDSRVIPARLLGRRSGGGRVEFLLLSRHGEGEWRAMVKPAKKVLPGDRIALETVQPDASPREEAWAAIRASEPDGTRVIALESSLPETAIIDRFGRMPLPPYILAARKGEAEEKAEGGVPGAPSTLDDAEDRNRYQTVYARHEGSVAAPTAGLHFTPELLLRLETRGVEVQRVTLHVGAGTFAPVKVERIGDHVMHAEDYEIGEAAARGIESARRDPDRRVVAVGTTVARTLESCMLAHGAIVPTRGSTRLMIVPGHRFSAVDALLTNFHLPKSTLLMLVSAFAGREAVLMAYREAIGQGYRFYSYGDAMFIR